MPDNRYSGYGQRPVQGSGNMRSSAPQQAGSAQTGPAGRPSQAGGQTRPAAARPAQSRPAGTAGSAPRQAQPQRGYAASGAPTRAPQGGAVRTANGTARPGARQAGGGYPQGSGTARPRPAGSSAGQRNPGRTGSSSASRPVQPRTNGVQRRPVSGSGYGYSGAANGGYRMPPALRFICFVLITAILMAASVFIADRIRSSQPQPVITMNTADPLMLVQNTDQPAAGTDLPQVTDAPAAPTNVPAAATDVPAAPTNVPQSEPAASGRSATIRAIGDVIIDQATLDNCETGDEVYDFSPLFELVSGVMSDADWTMINIEGTLRRHSKYGYMGYPQFFTPHSILEDLKEVGVDMLTMCNNHALDGWYDGLKMSLDYADAAGFAHVGAYRTQEEHDTPEVYDIGGIKVGMVNYTQFTNSMESQCDPEATIYGMRLMRNADYEGDIADLRNAGAEFTIAIMHWGTEYVREPDDDIEVIAERLVAAGADLVIGGHPHVVQPAEYITATQADGTQNTALVIYSLGNFYSEHRKSHTDNGVIFEFTLSDDGQGGIEMSAPAFIPIYMWQNEGAGAYEFRAVPSGVYLDNPPAGMSGSQYERMVQSYQETVDLIGGVIEIKAD